MKALKSVLAAAAAVASMGVAQASGPERSSEPKGQVSQMGGSGLIAVLAALAGVVAFFALTGDGSDAPVSP